MKNLVLSPGCVVRYHLPDAKLNQMGFVLGKTYKVEVFMRDDGLKTVLGVRPHGRCEDQAVLVSARNLLTNLTDNFSTVDCPFVLAVGSQPKLEEV